VLNGCHGGGELVNKTAGKSRQTFEIRYDLIQLPKPLCVLHRVVGGGEIEQPHVVEVLTKLLDMRLLPFLELLDQNWTQ